MKYLHLLCPFIFSCPVNIVEKKSSLHADVHAENESSLYSCYMYIYIYIIIYVHIYIYIYIYLYILTSLSAKSSLLKK